MTRSPRSPKKPETPEKSQATSAVVPSHPEPRVPTTVTLQVPPEIDPDAFKKEISEFFRELEVDHGQGGGPGDPGGPGGPGGHGGEGEGGDEGGPKKPSLWERLLMFMQKFVGQCADGWERIKSAINKFAEYIFECLKGKGPLVY